METGENFPARDELMAHQCLTYMQQISPGILNDNLRKEEKQSGKVNLHSEL